LAAIEGLGRMGRGDAAKVLLAALAKADGVERRAIVAAVKRLTGKDALAEVATGLASQSPVVREVAVRTVADHRMREHAGTVMKLTRDPEPVVVRAAFKSLAVLAGESEMPELIDAALRAEDDKYREAVSAVIGSIAVVVTGRDKSAKQLVSAYKDADAPRRCWILSVLPAFAGASALDTVIAASTAPEKGIRDAAVRALAAWPAGNALPALMVIVANETNDNRHALALPGAVRLSRETTLPVVRRLDIYAQMLKSSSATDEIWQIVAAMSDLHETGAIELIMPLLDLKDVRSEVAVSIAQIACPETGEGPVLPQGRIAELNKACDLLTDKLLKKKFSERLARMGR
ncbi:MAG: HEAT repeat domain-containing protein, partial [bacterium]